MNHNFASFELTKLLPLKNEFGNLHKELNEYFWAYPTQQQRKNKDTTNAYVTRRQHFYYIRGAWTWEDIRLYIKSRGFGYTVWEYKREAEDVDNRPDDYYGFIYWSKDNQYSSVSIDDLWFSTYEEAREECIKTILNIINNEH